VRFSLPHLAELGVQRCCSNLCTSCVVRAYCACLLFAFFVGGGGFYVSFLGVCLVCVFLFDLLCVFINKYKFGII